MLSDWGTVKIEDIAEVKSGKRLPKGHRLTDEITPYPYIRLVDIDDGRIQKNNLQYLSEETRDSIKRYIVNTNDVCLAIVGHSIGMVFYVEDKWNNVNLTENAARITNVDDSFNPRFIYYYLTSQEGQNDLISRKVGSAQGKLPLYNIRALELPRIPRCVQDTIVTTLDSLSFKIELNRQTNQTLEHMAQAIFKSWFVDFEPTRAKIVAKEEWAKRSMTAKAGGSDNNTKESQAEATFVERAAMAAISGRAIDSTNDSATGALAGLNPEQILQLKTTAALFPDTLVDSELGEIPEGWSWSEIGDEVVVAGGGTPSTKKEEYWEGGHIHWTSPRDMSNLTDKILIDTSRKITSAGLAKISSGLLPIDTVLMSSRAPVGYLAISKIPVAINQGYIAMKCEGALSAEYVVQWAESVMDDIKQRASGTTFAEISKKSFKIIPVVVPEKEVITAFTAVASSHYEKITEALRETKSLTETRDSLLPKLLSGEIELVG